jgi:hypothetical protein
MSGAVLWPSFTTNVYIFILSGAGKNCFGILSKLNKPGAD